MEFYRIKTTDQFIPIRETIFQQVKAYVGRLSSGTTEKNVLEDISYALRFPDYFLWTMWEGKEMNGFIVAHLMTSSARTVLYADHLYCPNCSSAAMKFFSSSCDVLGANEVCGRVSQAALRCYQRIFKNWKEVKHDTYVRVLK